MTPVKKSHTAKKQLCNKSFYYHVHSNCRIIILVKYKPLSVVFFRTTVLTVMFQDRDFISSS